MNILLLVIALFLVAHGLVHLLYVPGARPKDAADWPFQMNHSWLLTRLGLGTFTRQIGIGLIVLTVGGFILTALGLLGVSGLAQAWETLALFSAAVSLLLLVLFWNRMLVFGIVIDAAIALVLLWNQSPLPQIAQTIMP